MQTLTINDISNIIKTAFISENGTESINFLVETGDRGNWVIIYLKGNRLVSNQGIKIPMRYARNKKLLEKKLLNIRGALEGIGYKFRPFVL